MKYRIAVWTSAGFFIAGWWVLYAFATAPLTNERMRDVWIFACLTCPVQIAGSYFPLSLYSVLVANAATYALVGLMVETLRKKVSQAR
jgi:hypothetical protein